MLSLNITIFEQKGEKHYFLRYNAWNEVGSKAYRIKDAVTMIDDLKTSLRDLNPKNIETIVLTSEINNEGHEEYNPIGMRTLQELVSRQFPGSSIIYEIPHDTTQPQDYQQ